MPNARKIASTILLCLTLSGSSAFAMDLECVRESENVEVCRWVDGKQVCQKVKPPEPTLLEKAYCKAKEILTGKKSQL